mmetsp:Transcript_39275/g.80098  ORF Transcript_39275/g.80098 Transcript_39275/m.80098 type:complete len:96 (-) Transcript_39275:135-422(-)
MAERQCSHSKAQRIEVRQLWSMRGVLTTRKGLIDVVAIMGTHCGRYRAAFLCSWDECAKIPREIEALIKKAIIMPSSIGLGRKRGAHMNDLLLSL